MGPALSCPGLAAVDSGDPKRCGRSEGLETWADDGHLHPKIRTAASLTGLTEPAVRDTARTAPVGIRGRHYAVGSWADREPDWKRRVVGELMPVGSGPTGRLDVVIPEVWVPFYDETHIPAAVWIGDMLRLTGHTGEDADGHYPDGAEEQARGTFRNIAITLAEAGADWSDVVEINSYRVDLRSQDDVLLIVASEFLEAPYPVWTDVGVTELFPPGALVEISCVAVVASRHR